MDDYLTYLPPFISPLTHDEHAQLGRIAILWGQIDMILDRLIESTLGISGKQRQLLIGEKPIGAKLSVLSSHLDDLPDEPPKEKTRAFCRLAAQTKAKRNRCFHGVWGFRCTKGKKVEAAAMHYKDNESPVRAVDLAQLEKTLCATARAGMEALCAVTDFSSQGTVRLFHGKGSPPPWLAKWQEDHLLSDQSLDPRWAIGLLPFLKTPL